MRIELIFKKQGEKEGHKVTIRFVDDEGEDTTMFLI